LDLRTNCLGHAYTSAGISFAPYSEVSTIWHLIVEWPLLNTIDAGCSSRRRELRRRSSDIRAVGAPTNRTPTRSPRRHMTSHSRGSPTGNFSRNSLGQEKTSTGTSLAPVSEMSWIWQPMLDRPSLKRINPFLSTRRRSTPRRLDSISRSAIIDLARQSGCRQPK